MLIRALVLKARLAYYKGQPEQQYEAARRAVALAESLRSPVLAAVAQQSLGMAYVRLGRSEDAMRTFLAALELAKNSDDARLRGLILKSLALIQTYVPDLARARDYVEEARRVVGPTGDLWLMSEIDILRSIVSGPVEDNTSDLNMLVHANNQARRLELVFDEEISLHNLSDWYLTKRDWARAIEVSGQAVAVAQRFDEPEHSGLAYMNHGLALIGGGRAGEGIKELETAIGIFRHSGEDTYLANAIYELAKAYESVGRLKDAVSAHRDYRSVRDTNEGRSRARLVAEMQERFDAERRQTEILRLNEDNLRKTAVADTQRQLALFWGIVAAITIIAGAAIAFFARRTQRANARLLDANGRLAYLAERDSLTGLLNRRAMRSWIETQAHSDNLAPLALLLIDIDHFKVINDRLGHSVGDEVIIELGRRVQALLRDGDRLARWGGEEFLVVLRGVAAHQLPALALRVLRSISDNPFVTSIGPVAVTASMGYVPYPLLAESFDEGWEYHLGIADQALYRAKGVGRNAAFGVLAAVAPWNEIRRSLVENLEAVAAAGQIVTEIGRGSAGISDNVIPFGLRILNPN
nr:diguanylate cyclase [Niveibacterium umoris]